MRPIIFAAGMQNFLYARGMLNKNYKTWVMEQSEAIVEKANQYSINACGHPTTYIPSSNERKEALAHERQKQSGINSGLIGVWSGVESCNTFRTHFDAQSGFPQLRYDNSRCKHLYFYYDHIDYGFMSIRLQTWAPYGIKERLANNYLHA